MSFIKDKKYVNEICKNMDGEKCCSYLGVTGNGWECWKESVLRHQIEAKRKSGLMSCKGDNCTGYDNSKK